MDSFIFSGRRNGRGMTIPEFTRHSPGVIIRYIMEACSRMGCEEAAADVYCRSFISWDDLSNRYYIKIETRDDRKYTHYFDSSEVIIESDLVKIADEYIATMYKKKAESMTDKMKKWIENRLFDSQLKLGEFDISVLDRNDHYSIQIIDTETNFVVHDVVDANLPKVGIAMACQISADRLVENRKKETHTKEIESLKRYLSKNPDSEATSEPAPSIYVQLSKAIWKAFDEQEIDCDQLTTDISCDLETKRIKLQIFDKKTGCIYPFFIDQYAPGFDVDLAATSVATFVIDNNLEYLKKFNKNNNKNKEDNKMAQYNINRVNDEVIPMPKSKEEIDRENKLIELERIMKDKIKAAKDEYALAVKQMQEEEKAQSLVRRENEAATKWRVRYQALVDAGFTEEQAWKMMMQDIQA